MFSEIFDAEGSAAGGAPRISNTDGVIIDCSVVLERFRSTPVEHRVPPTKPQFGGSLAKGSQGAAFFHLYDPAITRKRTIDTGALKSDDAKA